MSSTLASGVWPQHRKDFLMRSAGMACQAFTTISHSTVLDMAHMLPAAVYGFSPVLNHSSYWSLKLALKGLFQETSVRGLEEICTPAWHDSTVNTLLEPFLLHRVVDMASVGIPDQQSLPEGDCSHDLLEPDHCQVGVEPTIIGVRHMDITPRSQLSVLSGLPFTLEHDEW
eukprot:scpid87026/ scgid30027/ 